jgi:hypothetical protein
LKYKNLTIEIQHMWNTSNTRGDRDYFKVKYMSKIPGNHEVKELQKTAILPYWALHTYFGKY